MRQVEKTLIRALFGGVALFLLAIISFNCIEKPLAPVAPTSDIVLQGISLVDVTKYFSEVEGKSKGTTINTDGTMSYISSQSSNPIKIDSIKLQLSPSGQSVGVGPFGVQAIPSTSQSASANQLGLPFSLPFNYPGAHAATPTILDSIPPFSSYYISLPGDTLNFSSQLGYIAINTGTLTLSFNNNLPLRITFNRPIILRNNQFLPTLDTSWIAVFTPGLIDSFATYTGNQSLAGRIIRAQVKFDSISYSTQQRSTSFSLKSNQGIGAQFSSGSLIADSAMAIVPSQTVTSIDSAMAVLDDSMAVQSATFSAGSFQMKLVNNLGIDVGVNFKINEFLKSGSSVSIDTILHEKQTVNIPFLGSQLGIRTNATASTLGTKITYSVGIKTISSGGQKKAITENDYVSASIVPGAPLVLKSVTGKIKTQYIQINSKVASGFGEVSNLTADSIKFQGIVLTVRFPMTGGYPMDYHLNVIAKSKGVTTGSIALSTDLPGFSRLDPSRPVITISNAPGFDNFLSKFFPNTPDSFYVTGSVTLNPDFANPATSLYSTYDTTKIYPSFDVNFPFAVGITNGRITNISGFGKGEVPKDFTKAVKQGTLTFSIFNRIPINMYFRAFFLGNYSPVTHRGDTLLTITPSDSIHAAPIDQHGYATSATTSRVSITLNGTQMEQFNNADSLLLRFNLATTGNGQVVRVRDVDYIRIYAKGDITYTINKP